MVFIEDNEEEEEIQPEKVSYPPSMYVSEGKHYQKLSNFRTALACFEEGLELYPRNIPCLVGKGQCLIRLGHYDEANSCADEALKIKPESPEACYIKGDAEFYRGNFEKSYEVFVDSSSKRPNEKNLKKGHQLCLNVIESYGPEYLSGVRMDEVKNKKKMEKKRVEVDKPPKSKRTKIPYSNVALFRRAYYSDIKFVEALLEDVEDSANTQYQDLWVYLNGLKPVAKYQNPKKSQKQQGGVCRRCLQDCEKAYKDGDTRACLLRGYHTLESLGGLPVQERKKVKARVFHLMGLSYITRKDLGSALEFLTKELKVGEELDSPGLKFRSWRAIGEVHLKSRRFDEAKEAFRNSLQFEADWEEEFLWCDEWKSVEGSVASEEEESVDGGCCALDLDLQMMLAEIAMRERRIDDAIAIYREALRMATSDDDPRAEEVRSQLQILEQQSMSGSTDGDITNTDDSETTMVTCQEEISDNTTNASSQENS